MLLTTKLADKYIGIESPSTELRDFFKDYLVENHSPDFIVSCTEQDVMAEQDITDASFPYHYLETLAILRKISELFPSQNRLLIHGAAISYHEKAYLFTAPSGTGKSTHICLWRKYLGQEVQIVNGDKPFVSLDSEQTYIYGTPWAGKENWQRNCQVPLNGICFLQRGTTNSIRQLSPMEALPLLMRQVYLSKTSETVAQTLGLVDTLMQKVPLYLLKCDMSEEAVRCSFEKMTGEIYSRS